MSARQLWHIDDYRAIEVTFDSVDAPEVRYEVCFTDALGGDSWRSIDVSDWPSPAQRLFKVLSREVARLAHILRDEVTP